jgi:hypothetical protein
MFRNHVLQVQRYSSRYSSGTYFSRTETHHGVTALNGLVNRHDNTPLERTTPRADHPSSKPNDLVFLKNGR